MGMDGWMDGRMDGFIGKSKKKKKGYRFWATRKNYYSSGVRDWKVAEGDRFVKAGHFIVYGRRRPDDCVECTRRLPRANFFAAPASPPPFWVFPPVYFPIGKIFSLQYMFCQRVLKRLSVVWWLGGSIIEDGVYRIKWYLRRVAVETVFVSTFQVFLVFEIICNRINKIYQGRSQD